MCQQHPHAQTLPNSSKYYMVAYIDGRVAGLAVWGYGQNPRRTPHHLFGDASSIGEFLELCRFFVYDWCPPNTASRFLAVTHRIVKKHVSRVKWLYTYAAGFQGLIGTIYQAANYDYIGKQLCNSFVYIPGRGLVHNVSLWDRFGTISGSNDGSLRRLQTFAPNARRWCGYNFRYIYWTCSKSEKRRLMASARFQVQPYPNADDLQIWLENVGGEKQRLTPAFAKSVPIVKLKTNRARAGSVVGDASANHAEESGSIPTPAL